MTPYRVHLDDWTVALYASDDGRLTFTVTNRSDTGEYLTRVVGDVRLRRYYIGQMCAGELRPSPFPTYRDACPDGCFCERCVKPASKEAILAREGAG